MSEATGTTDPGWYPCPGNPKALLRWWDGNTWTDQTKPANTPATTAAAAEPDTTFNLGAPAPGEQLEDDTPRRSRLVAILAVGIAVGLILAFVATRGDDKPATASASPTIRPATPTEIAAATDQTDTAMQMLLAEEYKLTAFSDPGLSVLSVSQAAGAQRIVIVTNGAVDERIPGAVGLRVAKTGSGVTAWFTLYRNKMCWAYEAVVTSVVTAKPYVFTGECSPEAAASAR